MLTYKKLQELRENYLSVFGLFSEEGAIGM